MVSQKGAAFFYVYNKDSFFVPGLSPLPPIFIAKTTWGLLKMGKNVLLIHASIRKMYQKASSFIVWDGEFKFESEWKYA